MHSAFAHGRKRKKDERMQPSATVTETQESAQDRDLLLRRDRRASLNVGNQRLLAIYNPKMSWVSRDRDTCSPPDLATTPRPAISAPT
jgi:hypothetical protein